MWDNDPTNPNELKDWEVLILLVVFFIGVWGVLLGFLTWLSKIHTWFLAIFAVGIGAPRWCQVSDLRTWLPPGAHDSHPDALGCLFRCAVRPMGGRCWTLDQRFLVAMAGSP